jgi:hypothetical protein
MKGAGDYTHRECGSQHDDDNNMMMIKIQFNSYLLTCKLNSLEANYKVSTSQKKETTAKLKQNT